MCCPGGSASPAGTVTAGRHAGQHGAGHSAPSHGSMRARLLSRRGSLCGCAAATGSRARWCLGHPPPPPQSAPSSASGGGRCTGCARLRPPRLHGGGGSRWTEARFLPFGGSFAAVGGAWCAAALATPAWRSPSGELSGLACRGFRFLRGHACTAALSTMAQYQSGTVDRQVNVRAATRGQHNGLLKVPISRTARSNLHKSNLLTCCAPLVSTDTRQGAEGSDRRHAGASCVQQTRSLSGRGVA